MSTRIFDSLNALLNQALTSSNALQHGRCARAIRNALPRATRRARLPGLDALRGIAALCVVVAHFVPDPRWSLLPALRAFQEIFSGSLAVAYFFTLSAFLLTYLGVREYDRTGTISLSRFFVRRICRI